jgi:hypothetical protein
MELTARMPHSTIGLVNEESLSDRARAADSFPELTVVVLLLGLLCVGCGWFGQRQALELLNAGNECEPAQDETDRLGSLLVFQQPPATANPTAQATTWQPCEIDSDNTGGRRVLYASTLSDDEIAAHYRRLARTSHWELVPDKSVDRTGLVVGRRWLRNRCLWLGVYRDTDHGSGAYVVQIEFWPRYARSYCDD